MRQKSTNLGVNRNDSNFMSIQKKSTLIQKNTIIEENE